MNKHELMKFCVLIVSYFWVAMTTLGQTVMAASDGQGFLLPYMRHLFAGGFCLPRLLTAVKGLKIAWFCS